VIICFSTDRLPVSAPYYWGKMEISMFLASLAAAALLMQADDSGDAAARVQARVDAAKHAYQTCIASQAAQMYHGRDDKRLERLIGESCNSAFGDWLDAMSIDSIPEAKEAARDAMQPILNEAIHLAVLEEAEARRLGRRGASES
jgi:hypothetical protein